MKTPLASLFAPLALSLPLALAACSSVHHATRPEAFPDAKEPSLVEVRTTGYDGAYKVVSYSTWDVDPNDELPASAPDDVVDAMREEAAAYGADMLLLDRVEDAWRKVWLGLGVKKADSGDRTVPACVQKGFDAAVADARARAARCTKGILYGRPGLRGRVEAVFEIDPDGRVLRAAPTPDSSRDSSYQECVLQAVHATSFGTPIGFSCQGRVAVAIDPTGAVQ